MAIGLVVDVCGSESKRYIGKRGQTTLDHAEHMQRLLYSERAQYIVRLHHCIRELVFSRSDRSIIRFGFEDEKWNGHFGVDEEVD